MSSANLQSISPNTSHIKSLRQVEAPQRPQVQNKALGGSGNAELATWYEQAHSYYNSVMSGQAEQPGEAEWNEFINQMNWAYQKLMGSGQSQGWDPMYGEDVEMVGSGGYSQESFAPSDPFGGIPGTGGQWVHNQEEAHVGFLGNQNRDIWANEVTIDVAPLSGRVEVVKVMDESVQPPVEVIKIVVTDAATGTKDVYKIYDSDDADIKIRAADPGAVSGADSLGISVEKFKESQGGKGSAQASIEGEAHPENDDHWIYEGRVGQYAEFYPEGSGEEGHEEFHEIFGDARIITRPSDHVMVSKGMPEDPDGYTVTVEHRDGSIDTYYIHKGFDVDLNAMPEYTTWSDGSVAVADLVEGEHDSVPSEFSDNFTLNGGATTGRSEDVPGDEPTETDGDIRIWDGSSFDITTRRDGKTSKIYARDEVTLHAHSNQETWEVAFRNEDGELFYEITVKDAEGEVVEIIQVDNMTDKLTLDIDPSRLTFLGDLGAEFSEGRQLNTQLEAGQKIELVGSDDELAAAGVGETDEDETQTPAATWPNQSTDISNQIPPNAPHLRESNTLIGQIHAALASNDWSQVYRLILSYSKEGGNDVIRNVISAIYGYAGDREGLLELLDLIPENVRQAMVSKVQEHTGELDEYARALFNSAETGALINESLTETGPSEEDED